MIEAFKHLVRSFFTVLQTIPRIWRFRTKRLLELHQTLFSHPKQRKKRSGNETIWAMAQVNMFMAAWAWPDGRWYVLITACWCNLATLYIFPYRLLAVKPLFWPMSCHKRSRYSNRAVTTLIEQSYLVMCDRVLAIIIIIIICQLFDSVI